MKGLVKPLIVIALVIFVGLAVLRGRGFAFGPLGLWEFLTLIILVPVLSNHAYRAYCISQGVPVGHGARAQTAKVGEAERARLIELEKRLARIEDALAELKRNNESLSEDYRFIQRVLEKDK